MTDPVRVAVVIPRYAPIFGGAENQCRQVNRATLATGQVAIPFIVTKRITPVLPPIDVVDGVTVVRLGKPGISRWSEYGFYARAFVFLWRRRKSYDVVHCHATSLIGFVMTVLGQAAGVPVILKLSSNGELVAGMSEAGAERQFDVSVSSRLRRPLASFMARHACMIALNEEGLDELRLVGARHALVVPNGVDTNHFHRSGAEQRIELRAKHGLTDADFIFVYAGRFVATKGIDLLIAAIDALAQTGEHAATRFVFVGSGELQGAAVSIDAEQPTVRLFPPTDDVLPFLQLADAFVHPSRREGMPNAVLEALAVGLPCVLSDIRPHRELAAANSNAQCILFRSGDAHDLAAALRACCELNHNRDNTTVRSIDSDFALVVVAQRYVELYQALAGRGLRGTRR